jgi:hypothetical protein
MTTLLKRSLFILCMMGLTSSLATMGYAAGPDLNEASNKKILVGALVKGTQQVNLQRQQEQKNSKFILKIRKNPKFKS